MGDIREIYDFIREQNGYVSYDGICNKFNECTKIKIIGCVSKLVRQGYIEKELHDGLPMFRNKKDIE